MIEGEKGRLKPARRGLVDIVCSHCANGNSDESRSNRITVSMSAMVFMATSRIGMRQRTVTVEDMMFGSLSVFGRHGFESSRFFMSFMDTVFVADVSGSSFSECRGNDATVTNGKEGGQGSNSSSFLE